MTKYTSISSIIVAVILMTAGTDIAAQFRPEKDSIIDHTQKIAVETSLSTMGLGVNLVYQFHPRITLRAGYENIGFAYPFNFEENDISYKADLNYKSGTISLLADYFLARFVYLSAGCAYNLFHPEINGNAAKDWQYGDIIIPAEEIGEFSALISPSLRLSPYLGLGIGRNISLKKRFSFNFEIGTYYQGPPKIEINATGLLSPTADESHRQKEILQKQFKSFYLYPLFKLGVSYVLIKM